LAIVGMSLDDEFLRKQIENSRRQIKDILWFNSSFDEEQEAWLANARVRKVEMPWSDFWAFWGDQPVAIDEAELHVAWWLALALEEVGGGHLTAFAETMRVIEPDNVPQEYGEPGVPTRSRPAHENGVGRRAGRRIPTHSRRPITLLQYDLPAHDGALYVYYIFMTARNSRRIRS
jgi:hypothetical protein